MTDSKSQNPNLSSISSSILPSKSQLENFAHTLYTNFFQQLEVSCSNTVRLSEQLMLNKSPSLMFPKNNRNDINSRQPHNLSSCSFPPIIIDKKIMNMELSKLEYNPDFVFAYHEQLQNRKAEEFKCQYEHEHEHGHQRDHDSQLDFDLQREVELELERERQLQLQNKLGQLEERQESKQ